MMKIKIPKLNKKHQKSVQKEMPLAMPRIITFWSPKATGKTILAAALSAALASEGKRVVCVDFDLLTPDLPHRGYGLDQIAEELLLGDFDPRVTALKLPCLKPTRVHLLSGPTDIVRAEILKQNEVQSLINALAEYYDMVVIDTNRALALDVTLVALDAADVIIVPVTPKDNIVRHVGRYLNVMENGLCHDMQKIRFVLNQGAEKSTALSTSDIERVLGRKITNEIPYCQGWESWDKENLLSVDGKEDLLLKMVNPYVVPPKEVSASGSSELVG